MSLYNYSITGNLNKLFFCFDFSKGDVIKVFCFLSVSNRCRTPTKHKMRVTSPYMFKYNRTETYFCKLEHYLLYEGKEIIFFSKLSGKTTGKLSSYELTPTLEI